LERLFDENDVPLKMKVSTDDAYITKFNVGIEKDPKYVKLSSILSEEQREKYTKLLKEFVEVFTWNYEDIKTYETSIIDHKIPLK
jgi:hypothetical protein